MTDIQLEHGWSFQRRLRVVLHPESQFDAERDYCLMLDKFRRCGGVMSCIAVTDSLRRTESQPVSKLARWIVTRAIVTLSCQGRVLVPLFQFSPNSWALRAEVSEVLDELRMAFDDWEMARWFVLPNAWLDTRAPLECLDEDAQAVRMAARADRLVTRG